MKKTKNSKMTEQQITAPATIRAAREYLEGEVGLLQANVPFFLYLLEDPKLKGFVKLLQCGRQDKIDPNLMTSVYRKRLAQLREKVVKVADLCLISGDDERDSFIAETMLDRKLFEPIDKTTLALLKSYAAKVEKGMKPETAIKELQLNIDMLNFVTVHESSDLRD